MNYVYLLQSELNNEIYIGSTTDLRRRIIEHNKGRSTATKRYIPWKLVYYEAFMTETMARKREHNLKYNGNAIRELKKRLGFGHPSSGKKTSGAKEGLPSTTSRKPSGAGFTLIELLVVIAIIGMLSSVVLASLNGARSKARDARRIADLQQIRTALELYYSAHNTYPAAGVVCNVGQNAYGDVWCRDTTDNTGATPIQNWIPGLEEVMPSMPHNPKPYSSVGPWPYHYYSPDANRYFLFTALENTTQKPACGGGVIYYWFGDTNSNTCTWWGAGLYAINVY